MTQYVLYLFYPPFLFFFLRNTWFYHLIMKVGAFLLRGYSQTTYTIEPEDNWWTPISPLLYYWSSQFTFLSHEISKLAFFNEGSIFFFLSLVTITKERRFENIKKFQLSYNTFSIENWPKWQNTHFSQSFQQNFSYLKLFRDVPLCLKLDFLKIEFQM